MVKVPVTCELGELQVRSAEVLPDGKVLQHIWTEFRPELDGVVLMKRVANGIEGIESVDRDYTTELGTIELRIRDDVDVEATAKRFIRAVATTINEMTPREQRELLVRSTDSLGTGSAMAVHSMSRSSDR